MLVLQIILKEEARWREKESESERKKEKEMDHAFFNFDVHVLDFPLYIKSLKISLRICSGSIVAENELENWFVHENSLIT